MAGARGMNTIDNVVLAPIDLRPDSYLSPWYTVADGTGHLEVTMVLSDTRITTPGLHLDMYMDGTDDPTVVNPLVTNIDASSWDSGPLNQPRIPGDPLPRPGTGWTTLPAWCRAVRGRLTIVLTDGTPTVNLGVNVTTG